ncbi:hypothetical protein GOODEAATRI_003741 [Goodea atripinnis]|uniref:Uncharacterized protein n=1 Tax=Goodea atripinnis TaxID=208336 RepID=A0ABV0NH85_9TELE
MWFSTPLGQPGNCLELPTPSDGPLTEMGAGVSVVEHSSPHDAHPEELDKDRACRFEKDPRRGERGLNPLAFPLSFYPFSIFLTVACVLLFCYHSYLVCFCLARPASSLVSSVCATTCCHQELLASYLTCSLDSAFNLEVPGPSPTSSFPHLEEVDPRLQELELDPPSWRQLAFPEVLKNLSKKETKRQEVINGTI